MVANQKECSRFQRSVIKILVAEKSKLCEIYRRMCDVSREACFSKKKKRKKKKKMFTNELNMSLPLQTRVEKIVHRMKTH